MMVTPEVFEFIHHNAENIEVIATCIAASYDIHHSTCFFCRKLLVWFRELRAWNKANCEAGEKRLDKVLDPNSSSLAWVLFHKRKTW